ncbi:hypothetical protein SSP24_44900 [Streptomyces spinoverrucosus]|uniref:Uncharacterized protein n=1 Tax=Streptomyces spinoverrucosus TaxID=284043 RepID=A0A4Y3VL34_9ACTN|nr:hypothetical protein SSP24_44900 [Streptomyces spinoverrucosus]GHB80045.1 hypothetical protein GCM10010397_58450 [Streptomyces spinoverrucosus]
MGYVGEAVGTLWGSGEKEWSGGGFDGYRGCGDNGSWDIPCSLRGSGPWRRTAGRWGAGHARYSAVPGCVAFWAN